MAGNFAVEVDHVANAMRPAYSPVGLPVANNSTVDVEPLVFDIPMHRRMDTAPEDQRQPYVHALPIRELTSVRIFAPGAAAGPALVSFGPCPRKAPGRPTASPRIAF